MKKNISINIGGIIFHIEEDGYDTLRKYLDSVNRYFASFEDSAEILADIEGRIAEIFLARLNEGKQVITAEDVTALISTMGSVSDFKAAEQEENAPSGESSQGYREQRSYEQPKAAAPRRLFRDRSRKVLGGVCAGLGNYLNIDMVWPRVLFALLTLGTSGVFLIIYIVMWIVVPEADLEEVNVKKMFRDPERKVLGGVASGVAAFFNADLTLVRVLFVISIFVGGFGIILYIVLWIALPEAKSITDRMQMQGEPVTLSNIESSVKKGLNERDATEESPLTKIILFPFRAIAALFTLLAPALRMVVEVFRVAIGILISMTGFFMILALLIAFGVVAGIMSPPDWHLFSDGFISTPNIPLSAIRNSLPGWMTLAAFLAAMIPALFTILLGSSIIARRIVFNAATGWSLFVLFFLSVGVLSFSLPQFIYGFKEEGEYRVEETFSIAKGTPVFRVNETGMDDYNVTSLYLRGYDGKDIRVVQRFEAQGSSRKMAAENAQMVEYKVTQSDSVITFDSNITFKDEAKFRAQRLDIDVYVPFDQKVYIDGKLWRLIDNRDRMYFREYDEMHTIRITRDGWDCIDCTGFHNDTRMLIDDQYGLDNFNAIDLQGIFDCRIEQGDSFAVVMEGDAKEKDRYEVYKNGSTLVIDYREKRRYFWKRNPLDGREVRIRITLPELRDLEVRGGGKLVFKGFDEDEMNLKFTGAVLASGEVTADRLSVELTGASMLDLDGKGRFLEADITGASALRAYGYEVEQGVVEAHGASMARVNVSDRLEIKKGVASSISHRGGAEVIRR